jgi:hypothetical protein
MSDDKLVQGPTVEVRKIEVPTKVISPPVAATPRAPVPAPATVVVLLVLPKTKYPTRRIFVNGDVVTCESVQDSIGVAYTPPVLKVKIEEVDASGSVAYTTDYEFTEVMPRDDRSYPALRNL